MAVLPARDRDRITLILDEAVAYFEKTCESVERTIVETVHYRSPVVLHVEKEHAVARARGFGGDDDEITTVLDASVRAARCFPEVGDGLVRIQASDERSTDLDVWSHPRGCKRLAGLNLDSIDTPGPLHR